MRRLRPVALLALLLLAGCRSASTEHWIVGQMELEVGNYRAAISASEKARKQHPEHAPTYLALAAAYTRQGDHEQVAELLKKYLTLRPDHREAHLYLGECYLSLGQKDLARQEFVDYLQPGKGQLVAGHEIHAQERLAELTAEDADLFDHHRYAAIALLLRTEMVLAEDKSEDSRRLVRPWLDEADGLIGQARDLRPSDAEVQGLVRRLAALEGQVGQQSVAATLEATVPAPARTNNLPFLQRNNSDGNGDDGNGDTAFQSMLDDAWRRR